MFLLALMLASKKSQPFCKTSLKPSLCVFLNEAVCLFGSTGDNPLNPSMSSEAASVPGRLASLRECLFGACGHLSESSLAGHFLQCFYVHCLQLCT